MNTKTHSESKGSLRLTAIKNALTYPLYILIHPADGFYGMKYERKGKVLMIFFNVLLFWISYSFMQQYGGLVINTRHPMTYNSATDFTAILALFILFCVANWTVTSLANGEGRLVDIMMAVAYAFTPMNLLFIPSTILSNFLVDSEAAFVGMIISFAVVYFVVMLFVGIMTVHNYTVAKTAITFGGTALSMIIIVFIILMISTLVQQVWIFGRSVYIEMFF